MATKRRSQSAKTETFAREQYKGHDILLPRDERARKVFINGRPIEFGIAGGTYYLSAHAYEPGKTLLEVVQRYIEAKEKRATARKKGRAS